MPDEQPTVPIGEHCGPGPKVAAWVLGILFLVSVGLAAFLWMRIGFADQQLNALHASVQRLDNEKAALELTIDAMEDEQAMMEEEAEEEETVEPAIVFTPSGLFEDEEEALLVERIVEPYRLFHQDQEGVRELRAFSFSKQEDSYLVDILFYPSGYHGQVLETDAEGNVDWYVPECLGSCEFSEEFRTRYPQIVERSEASTPEEE